MRRTLLVLALWVSCSHVYAVTFDWVHVGNASNAPDPETGRGAVDYDFAIAKHEVTNAQYVEFLNAVAASDPHDLYKLAHPQDSWYGVTRSGEEGAFKYSVKPPASGKGPGGTDYTYENKPVVYVSFFDVMRFVNWLHNGQGDSDTETGVYEVSYGRIETRSRDAQFWVPNEDEWYKAAYHDASAGTTDAYFDFPTRTDDQTEDAEPSGDTGNSANIDNYRIRDISFYYSITDVGEYDRSVSPYGTFDQGGNVLEWNETILYSNFRSHRGGSWYHDWTYLHASNDGGDYPSRERNDLGFRIATRVIPEPTAALLMLCGLIGVRRR